VQVCQAVTDALKAERILFSFWLLEEIIQERSLIFLDEVGFKLSQRVSYGRSEKGEPARLISPGIRTRNITVMAAMTKNGLEYVFFILNMIYKFNTCEFRILSYQILDGNGNQESFRQFLHQIQADANAAVLGDATIVMDNVSFHKTNLIREELVILGLSAKYLPAYSPFFNPIENMFSKWKNHVKRRQAMNEVELTEAMNEVRAVVTAEDCSNYVAKVVSNCDNCTNHNLDYFNN
jgi:transposase